MSFSLAQILLFIVAYLTGLFTVAHLADRGIIPARITHHPATYILSLGVFAGATASNGVVALAHQYGYNFLLYYVGVVLMVVMAALLLMPLLRLCRVYQLSSLADVLTFRFRSPWVGAAITVAMCITVLPLLALQIQAVADSIHILAGDSGALTSREDRLDRLAQLFCIIIIVFSILFGTRHVSSQHRNTGLVTAIAFESLVKLVALLILMLAAIYQVFGGLDDLEQWLLHNPQASQMLEKKIHGDTARALLLMFFAGAVCMPHIFHMAFAENTDSRDLRGATWGLPLYLLLLSLPILPVTWAGMKLGHDLPMDYSGLAIGLALHSIPVSATAFVAGLSAASATIIVTTLALANMCLNHLVLPSQALQIDRAQSIYTQLKWLRRSLIAILILAGYTFFVMLGGKQTLTQLALVAFTGTLQFLPGIIATPYWPGANRRGLLVGLGGGQLIWFFSMLLPLTIDYHPLLLGQLYASLFGPSQELWPAATIISLALNTGLFITVSLLTRTSADEKVAAEICSMDDLARPTRQTLALRIASEFSQHLTPALSERTARYEVEKALAELQFSADETRPYALRRLRARIEANLSGLLGPAVAHSIIERCIPFLPGLHENTDDIHLIERDLDRAELHFTGLAANLDNLRRHHRETLDNLPTGVCSIGADSELLMWNRSMERITGIQPREILGSLLGSIPEPWQQIIGEFQRGDADNVLKTEVIIDAGTSRWVSLHKAAIRETGNGSNEDTVILVEDITELELLEEEVLHNERLASIGRLAAGVAHEIGNPITGIACLAQNLEYETDPMEIQCAAQDILRQTERVTRIVDSLVNFSHQGSSSGDIRLTPTNLADCVDEAAHLLTLDREAKPVQFTNHCNREVLVLADSQRLLQVFVNLLGNARDACDDFGQVQVSTTTHDDQVRINVEDNGCGIEPEIQSQVFEPFYTTKDPGVGTGLGLALVFSIMDDMDGTVHLSSPIADGEHPGTRVTLQLPRTSYGIEFEM
jgi:PAS domain S-box-containing protein